MIVRGRREVGQITDNIYDSHHNELSDCIVLNTPEAKRERCGGTLDRLRDQCVGFRVCQEFLAIPEDQRTGVDTQKLLDNQQSALDPEIQSAKEWIDKITTALTEVVVDDLIRNVFDGIDNQAGAINPNDYPADIARVEEQILRIMRGGYNLTKCQVSDSNRSVPGLGDYLVKKTAIVEVDPTSVSTPHAITSSLPPPT